MRDSMPMLVMPDWLRRSVILCLLSTVLLWAAGTGSAGAQSSNPATRPPEHDRPDVRVVVDVSGSMKANDPNRLSGSALDMLVALLPGGISAGVWTFGERVDNPLPLAPVDSAWREDASDLPPALQNYQQYTDVEAALRTASAVDGNGQRHLILLTDGVIDLPPTRGAKPAEDIASRARVLDAMAPDLVRQGVVVHAIAFSAGADVAMVERLAQQTGGLAAVVETPQALLGAFLDIVERIFPAEQVPLDDDGSFVIDANANDFSALVFHRPSEGEIALIAPDGTLYSYDNAPDEISWQHEPRFDLIRVPDALPGEWRIEGAMGANSRITVSGELRLVTGTLPSTLYAGFEVPLEAWLESPEGMSAPEGLTVTATLSGEDLESPGETRLQSDGKRFSGRLPAPTGIGNARLVIDAHGEGFHRQRVQAVNILPAIGAVLSDDGRRVELVAEHPRLNRDNTELFGDLLGVSLVAEPVGHQRWEIVLPQINERLRQPLRIQARASMADGVQRWTLPTLWINADGSVSIDRAAAGPTLVGERLVQQADSASGQGAAPEALADRFVELVNNPRSAMGWIMSLWSTLKAHITDLRVWLGLTVLVLLWVAWRRWRRASGPVREEPRV